ncbi:ATP-NAD kinase family protein [Jannaschia seohaensis]|uniref:Predicted polyphosphate- or ATP-dependent NAD kinase n=1 Tax=Jannaschia seohaensis TaxID=475081 RepID=A0A2Y9C8A1_9RHOB|nr:NAD(+)/NADH kinase [Jannaschia seohaensis]PWJ17036.1 putative polyphosphate/ATP-dependent NAD kinase [Jannaschia seohaensis]SSA48373.1 Predicted polyphosphate- or ATP-dependent NAD kinase [Jannaschia seohaensis]
MKRPLKIGLIVNPNAGLGGAVGLKGTDGPDIVAQALARGAVAQAGPRVRRAMARLAARVPGAALVTVPGALGAEWVEGLDLATEVRALPQVTGTARDTWQAVMAMADCDLIVFGGGDGTARDVAGRVPSGTGILGVPCGVKMHSGVFAISPEAAGALLADLLEGQGPVDWDDAAEVMDIDEDALRAGRIAPRLYEQARTPKAGSRIQASKGGPRKDWGAELMGAAAEVVQQMEEGTVYVIGPGTSAGAVMRAAGHAPTVLGTDAMLNGAVVARDATARQLEDVSAGHPVKIVLGVTGQQGFLLGRGNQQIGPALIRRAGRGGLIVLGTEDKIAALAQPRLWVDTGDPDLDAEISGFVRVRTGYRREMMMRIAAS